MNGAESLVAAAIASNIEVCFANPGTTEVPVIVALDTVPGIKPILCLFEGVCTGAADGYARMAGKPALTLLHLGPGLGNGLANLHNARRARTSVVNLIGEQASWHIASDPPLVSDINSIASAVSDWVRTAQTAEEVARDTSAAIAAARKYPGGVATLILPSDCLWTNVERNTILDFGCRHPSFDVDAVHWVARMLSEHSGSLLLLGGHALREEGLQAAAHIAACTGCRLMSEGFPARMERGAGLPLVNRLPYFPDQIRESLEGTQNMVLAGCVKPVTFFGYPNQPSHPIPDDCLVHCLADPTQDVVGALQALADELGPSREIRLAPLEPPERPTGPLTYTSLGVAIAATQPEGAVVIDESLTTGRTYLLSSTLCPPHSYLATTGGSIGMGLPCATGAAVACPDRPVMALQADGSGMYTVQSLWTQAREGLNVTTVICANRLYRILRIEMSRDQLEVGPHATRLTNLGSPAIDWVQLSQGLGVPAVAVETADELVQEMERAFAESGPHLIEAIIRE